MQNILAVLDTTIGNLIQQRDIVAQQRDDALKLVKEMNQSILHMEKEAREQAERLKEVITELNQYKHE